MNSNLRGVWNIGQILPSCMCLQKWGVLVWPWSAFCPRTAVVCYPLLQPFLVTLPGEVFPSRIELQPHGQASSPVEAGKQGSWFLFLKLFLQYYFYSGHNQENLVLLITLYNICCGFFYFPIFTPVFPLWRITKLSCVRKGPWDCQVLNVVALTQLKVFLCAFNS